MEDKETALEMKKKLDGKLPSMHAPISIEISLKTTEVCNVWYMCVCMYISSVCVCVSIVCIVRNVIGIL